MNAPISIYTEMTNNPVTMKGVLNILLIEGEGKNIEFRTKEKAVVSPLATKVFELPNVNASQPFNMLTFKLKNHRVY